MVEFSYDYDTFSTIMIRCKQIMLKDEESPTRYSESDIRDNPMLLDENNGAITMLCELEIGKNYYVDLFDVWA